ncbi:MAG: hypothetical protein D6798_19595 [Deltaproteobacteria bacterium]|nr:MAG: hypothetical protein D6798_19595 [Deltaproteobacteria bacterium]
MLSAIVIAIVIVAVFGPTIKRTLDLKDPPVLVWPLMLLAAASPAVMGYIVLHPGEPVAEADISPLSKVVVLEAPPHHSILVTANLNEDPKGSTPNKTDYALALSGPGWTGKATGEIRRKANNDDDVDVDVLDGEQLSESGRRRNGKWGEDLQQRFDLKGPGPVQIELTNFSGEAASSLHIEVIKSPPPSWLLWIGALTLGAIALVVEIRHGPTQLAGDVAMVALYGVFLRDGVTPVDSFQRVAFAAAPAALVGWGIFASIGYLVDRKRAREARKAERERALEEQRQLEEALRKRRRR